MYTDSMTPPVVLTIAGSDSSGGAGVQADIKTISATGGYACSVITAITAQNTQGVHAVYPLPLAVIDAQLDAVFSDLNIIAVKIGMLAHAEVIQLVARKLQQYQPRYVVVDPVMISTSGTHLLQPDAIDSLKTALLPLADLITPNLPEAATLLHCPEPTSNTAMLDMAPRLHDLGAKAILLKAGHLTTSLSSDDLLITTDAMIPVKAKRIHTRNTHGTGCTLSSAIACYLAQGSPLTDAVVAAKHYMTHAIRYADGLHVGQENGPVDHFYSLRLPKMLQ